MNDVIIRSGERLTDVNGELVGWIADDGKFHPCGKSLTVGQLLAIIKLVDSSLH